MYFVMFHDELSDLLIPKAGGCEHDRIDRVQGVNCLIDPNIKPLLLPAIPVQKRGGGRMGS
jgi:hypothetical protein